MLADHNRQADEFPFTGSCPRRQRTASGHYMGRCNRATYAGRCPTHGNVARLLATTPTQPASPPADYHPTPTYEPGVALMTTGNPTNPLPYDLVLTPALQFTQRHVWQLNCPRCGDQMIDRENWEPDHLAVTVHPDRDQRDSPLGTRGGYVQVDLQCSEGHHFALIIANHKGMEFLGVVNAQDAL